MTLQDLITRQLALLAPPKDLSTALFESAGPVPTFQLKVDDANVNQLRQEPRKTARALLRVGELEVGEIGVHLKGAAGSTRGWDDKPGLTLNLDKFTKGQKLFGLEKLHLNNGVQDPTYFQELLGNELALAMGVPACRCAHALVELNGRKMGLYVLKEGFDKTWLRRHFPSPDGNLYDGGFCTDISGDLKLDVGVDTQRRELRGLAGLCQFPDANLRFEAVDRVVDIKRFCAGAALQILTCDWDGYVRKPNNYRVFFPKAGKAVFIPHGMDQLWQNPEEGLWQGWGGMVAHAVLNHPTGKQLTIDALYDSSQNHFIREKLFTRIDLQYVRTLAALKGTGDPNWAGWFEGEVRGLKVRLSKRMDYVRKEIPRLG